MFYCLIFYPQFSPELAESIDAIGSAYNPASGFIKPHITIIFPVQDSVGEQSLINHIQDVLGDWSPFTIRLGGFHRTANHWLFLTLPEGEAEVKRLYQALNTGILDDGGDFSWFLPHISLGLFVKEGITQDWRNPREEDFDPERYEEALRLAKALPLSESILVEKLQLVTIPDSVIDWTRGRRATIPDDADTDVVREFRLVHQNA